MVFPSLIPAAFAGHVLWRDLALHQKNKKSRVKSRFSTLSWCNKASRPWLRFLFVLLLPSSPIDEFSCCRTVLCHMCLMSSCMHATACGFGPGRYFILISWIRSMSETFLVLIAWYLRTTALIRVEQSLLTGILIFLQHRWRGQLFDGFNEGNWSRCRLINPSLGGSGENTSFDLGKWAIPR